MGYNWTDKEVTMLYERMVNLKNSYDDLLIRLKNREQKPDYIIHIDELRKEVKILKDARVVQIKLNNQFKLHNHEVRKVIEAESFWSKLFK